MADPRNKLPAFEPFIPASARIPEFTLRAIITGTILGMVFGASSLYLVLKVGLTVSASIPVAVISLALFRFLSKLGLRDSTILENNISQTAGSAGESIAFGVGITMPAIMILGFDLEIARVLLVGVLGGLLGILLMIPLRRALIVKEHGKLKFPEGTACAALLKAGASEDCHAASSPSAKAERREAIKRGATSVGAKVIFAGFGLGLLYKTAMMAFKGWKDTPEKTFGAPLAGGSVAVEVSPELLGVGYIIGPRIAAVMCAGGVLSYLVLIPMIKFFGEAIPGALSPASIPISQMSANMIRGNYVLYIGAGAVAAGGIISLVRSLPTIWHGLRSGLRDVRGGGGDTKNGKTPRTDRDLSMKLVGVGIIVLLAAIVSFDSLRMNPLGALLIVAFGFLFVTVSSRLTGEIGSSSNPISGMTIATLLLTCLIFLIVGWTQPHYYVTALSVGAIVCIASSNGGTTSQDLKTGYLVGATPRLQQVAILIGAFVSALVLGPILMSLNDNSTVHVPASKLCPAPLVTDVSKLERTEVPHVRIPLVGEDGKKLEGQYRFDDTTYHVWHKTDTVGGPSGKYLVDDKGVAVWFVDPGINGMHTERVDGSKVTKYDAPKATLVSYIIKGILDRELPWELVLLGVMIAVTLELAGIPSLAFAVGVYLPLSSSTPILAGGAIRWLVDRHLRKKAEYKQLSEEKFSEESDKSAGVLLSSGYIAGGAIAGIIIAYVAAQCTDFDTALTKWAAANNPFFAGEWASALAMIPFLMLSGFLLLVARGNLLGVPKAGK